MAKVPVPNGIGTPLLSDKKRSMTCKPSVSKVTFREEEIRGFGNIVPLIGKDVDMKQLGEYHVGHGDCLHWIMPGVPDIIAAELADSLIV